MDAPTPSPSPFSYLCSFLTAPGPLPRSPFLSLTSSPLLFLSLFLSPFLASLYLSICLSIYLSLYLSSPTFSSSLFLRTQHVVVVLAVASTSSSQAPKRRSTPSRERFNERFYSFSDLFAFRFAFDPSPRLLCSLRSSVSSVFAGSPRTSFARTTSLLPRQQYARINSSRCFLLISPHCGAIKRREEST